MLLRILCVWLGLIVGSTTMAVDDVSGYGLPDAMHQEPNDRLQHTQPNFVFVMVDDMSELEFNRATMPILFRSIVDQGTTFDEFIINTPLCGPSRATALTGLYAHNHGVKFCLDDPDSRKKWDAYYRGGFADNDAGAMFQRKGYFTAMVGKYINSYGTRPTMRDAFGELGHETYVPRGWNEFFVPTSLTYRGFTAVDNGTLRTIGNGSDSPFRTDFETNRGIAAIDAAADSGQPFMLDLWYFAPHLEHQNSTASIWASRHEGMFSGEGIPDDPDVGEADFSDKPDALQELTGLSPQYLQAYEDIQDRRRRSLQSVDEGVGRIVAHLDAIDQLDNTYIIFASDNGFSLGHHRLTAKSNPYERVINVPMTIRGPGVSSGVHRDETVSMVDILPTMMDLAGGPGPSDFDGESFAALLDGDSSNDAFRPVVLVEHWNSVSNQRNLEGQSVEVNFEYQLLRGPGFAYIEWGTGGVEYYDLVTDPFQLENAYDSLTASRQSELRRDLASLRQCRASSCRYSRPRVPKSLRWARQALLGAVPLYSIDPSLLIE